MSDDGDQAKPLSHSRQVTVDALCEHFANDVMSVEEFERRVEIAHRTSSLKELKELLQDLPGGNVPAKVSDGPAAAPAPRQATGVTAAAHVKERELMMAILGGSSRKGSWTPARKNVAIAVMGGAELDFREAVFGPGVTEVQVFAIWGGVEIIVPPWLRVESHVIGVLGGVDHKEDMTEQVDPDGPVLRITGAAIMGGVDIQTRLPGESAGDARRRRRIERKERRRLKRGR